MSNLILSHISDWWDEESIRDVCQCQITPKYIKLMPQSCEV